MQQGVSSAAASSTFMIRQKVDSQAGSAPEKSAGAKNPSC
jgi:hypothetical protein